MDDTAATDASPLSSQKDSDTQALLDYLNPEKRDVRRPAFLDGDAPTGWKKSLQEFQEMVDWFDQGSTPFTGIGDEIMHKVKSTFKEGLGSSKSRATKRQQNIQMCHDSLVNCTHSIKTITRVLRTTSVPEKPVKELSYQEMCDTLMAVLTSFDELTKISGNVADSRDKSSKLVSDIKTRCSIFTNQMDQATQQVETWKKTFAGGEHSHQETDKRVHEWLNGVNDTQSDGTCSWE